MSNRFTVPLRIAAVTAAATVAAVSFAPAASAAAEGDVEVTNTETVQVYTDATGEVQTRRIYEQLSLSGEGEVDLSNPIETDGLRNLDEFGGYEIEDGQQITNMTVDGEERLRSVSDFTGDLPLEVQVKYLLDGEEVEPGDVVGESGELEVLYTVRNVTSQPQEVSYTDGSGGEVTETVDVPIPMVGSLSTVAPPNFTDVKSDQANLAGDGKGGTKLSFTMTLFPPLGSDTAEFGFTATIEDGVVPRADITALPVNPLESPTFKTAADSYQGGSDTGEELAAGATEIDANLLKLRDGAGDLLAGLIQLRDGSDELADGLSGEAAPGAARLADGTEELRNGTAKLAAGTGKLDDGADKIADGADLLSDGLSTAGDKAPALIDGLGELRAGLVKVDRGLGTLYREVGSVRQNPQYKALRAGLDEMLAGVGTRSATGSLTWAVDQVRTGLETEAVPGLEQLSGGVNCASTVLGAVVNGQGAIPPGANPCFPNGFPGLPALDPANPLDNGRATVLNQVRAGLNDPAGVNPNPSVVDGLAQLKAGLESQDPNDPGALLALATVECALDSTSLGPVCGAVRPGKAGLRQGLDQVVAGVPLLVNTIITNVQGGVGKAADTPADETLRGGMSGLIDGTDRINEGGGDLIDGLMRLSDGAGDLSAGAGELAAGTGDLDSGADDLNEGAGQLNDGANELADGLGDAADGSVRLNEGLTEAAGGAPRLVDGTQELSDKGTSKLVEAGEETAQDYGQLYATIAAGAERADAENMAYGAPEGAIGLTAYSFVVQGETGESGRNWARGLAGLALLGAAGAAFALRRRFV